VGLGVALGFGVGVGGSGGRLVPGGTAVGSISAGSGDGVAEGPSWVAANAPAPTAPTITATASAIEPTRLAVLMAAQVSRTEGMVRP
jgi:hypothetical protein